MNPPSQFDDPAGPRRRHTDPEEHNTGLILYQLTELKADLREGFAKLDARFMSMEHRVTNLETFRTEVQSRQRAEDQASSRLDSRWIPVLATGATLAVTVVFAVLTLTGH